MISENNGRTRTSAQCKEWSSIYLYLSRALGHVHDKIVGITDWIRLSVTLVELYGEAHRVAHRVRVGPLKINLKQNPIKTDLYLHSICVILTQLISLWSGNVVVSFFSTLTCFVIRVIINYCLKQITLIGHSVQLKSELIIINKLTS